LRARARAPHSKSALATIVISRLVRCFFPRPPYTGVTAIHGRRHPAPMMGRTAMPPISSRRSGDHNAPCANRWCTLSLSSTSSSTLAEVAVAVAAMAVGGEGRVGTGPTFVHLRDLSTGPRARTHVRTYVRTRARTHARAHLRYAQGTRNPAPPSSTPMRTYARILSSLVSFALRSLLPVSTRCSDTYRQDAPRSLPGANAPASPPVVFFASFPSLASCLSSDDAFLRETLRKLFPRKREYPRSRERSNYHEV